MSEWLHFHDVQPTPRFNPMIRTLFLSLIISLSAIPLSAAESIVVRVDTKDEAHAIHPFVYGQFIEHLGRCIYGGIWAEMLEDRKFYFPVTAEYAPFRDLVDSRFPVVGASPWEITGDTDGVEMSRERPFVGEQSALVRKGSGIRQGHLEFQSGLSYTGYIWIESVDSEAEVEVTLVWGDSPSARHSVYFQPPVGEFVRYPFQFSPSGESGGLEIRVLTGAARVGTVSLMPSDHVNGMRRDTLALLKELKGTVYRWPGGNFVSGYDWRDGIGDRDRRPPRKNPAWTGVEHNDFGTDEFIAFCREVEAVPMIAANTGFGDAFSAAQWVEYCNGTTDTVAGSWRAGNGHEDPFDVRYWCVGNEMFGPWQLGFMQLEHYVLKHNMVAQAMRKADDNLVLVGVGDFETINKDYDPNQAKRGITWTHGMLESCADHMDMISEHFYRGRLPWEEPTDRIDTVSHVALLRDAIRARAEGHRKLQASLPNLKGRIIPIAMDEWNYWHREYEYGELGCSYDWADGMGVAAGLHEFFRQSDIIHMAHYAQTVNVIGAIKTSKTAAEFETTGLVLKMYREHFGTRPVALDGDWGDLDMLAALTDDGSVLTLGVVNPTTDPVYLALEGVDPAVSIGGWAISHPDPMAHNTPGEPRVVDVLQMEQQRPGDLYIDPLSVSIFTVPMK